MHVRPQLAVTRLSPIDLMGVSNLANLPLGWADSAGLSQNAVYRRVIPIKQSGNLMQRLAFPPMFPHECP